MNSCRLGAVAHVETRLRLFALLFMLAPATACDRSGPTPAEPAPAVPADEHEHGGRPKAPLGHRFEKADDWVPRFESSDRGEWQKPAEVVTLMDITEGMTVADIGAGTGYFLPYLSGAVGKTGKVFALDIEADMVRYMAERAAREHLDNVVAKVVLPDDPQLAPDRVDRILIVNTWHHIPDRVAYVKKLAHSMTPEARLFIVDFTMQSDVGPPTSHRLAPEKVEAELRAGGLEAKVLPNTLPKQYVVVGEMPHKH